MVVEKANNNEAHHLPSEKDYFTEWAFLGLGDILYKIAANSQKYGDIRSQYDERGNVKDNAENPSAVAILSKMAMRNQ